MKDLGEWRKEIDAVDRQIVDLLNRRAEIVLGLAPLKRAQGVPVYEPNRERLVIDNVDGSNHGPLPTEALKRIYRAVMQEMRAMQNRDD